MRKILIVFCTLIICCSTIACSNQKVDEKSNNNKKGVEDIKSDSEVEIMSLDEEVSYKQQELELLNEFKTHQDFWDNIKLYYEDEYKTKKLETMEAYESLGNRYLELYKTISIIDTNESNNNLRESIIYKMSNLKEQYLEELGEEWSINDLNQEVEQLLQILNIN